MIQLKENLIQVINFPHHTYSYGKKYAKAVSNSEEPKKFEVPNKKAVFLRKKTAFLSGTLNFFGPSYFETALVGFVYPEITSNL